MNTSLGEKDRLFNGALHVMNIVSQRFLELQVRHLPHLPSEYVDLTEAFSKKRASQLPNHRSVDCAIDLMPGAIPPKDRIFPQSQPKSALHEALH